MSKPPSKKPIGRPITDEKGNRTWEWRSDTKIDTTIVRALGEELSFETSSAPAEGSNPYDRTAAKGLDEEGKKRRTLDDMRRLSEKIKRSKHWTRDK
jgi:hypothetical protein